MGYSFACADLGGDCPGSFATATQDELMAHVQLHTQAAHPEVVAGPEMADALAGAIKEF